MIPITLESILLRRLLAKCVQCGNEFIKPHSASRMCSDACREARSALRIKRKCKLRKKSHRPIKQCLHCGKALAYKNDRKIYCDGKCRYHHVKDLPPKWESQPKTGDDQSVLSASLDFATYIIDAYLSSSFNDMKHLLSDMKRAIDADAGDVVMESASPLLESLTRLYDRAMREER